MLQRYVMMESTGFVPEQSSVYPLTGDDGQVQPKKSMTL